MGANAARQRWSNVSIDQTNSMLSACSAEGHDDFRADFEKDGERGILFIAKYKGFSG